MNQKNDGKQKIETSSQHKNSPPNQLALSTIENCQKLSLSLSSAYRFTSRIFFNSFIFLKNKTNSLNVSSSMDTFH